MSEHPFVTMMRQQAEEQNGPRQFPLWEAQLGTLREVQALVGDLPRIFIRGDIVRYVAQTGPMIQAKPDGMCMMFWRTLDPQTLDDQQRIQQAPGAILAHLDEIDCILMVFDGSCVHFHLGSTALLERDPRQDTVKRQ